MVATMPLGEHKSQSISSVSVYPINCNRHTLFIFVCQAIHILEAHTFLDCAGTSKRIDNKVCNAREWRHTHTRYSTHEMGPLHSPCRLAKCVVEQVVCWLAFSIGVFYRSEHISDKNTEWTPELLYNRVGEWW